MSKAISKNKETEYKEALQKAKNKIEQLQAENAQLNSGNIKCEIAVTGFSCRFPNGANSPEEFWKRLADGFDAVSEIKRFDVDSVYSAEAGEPGKMSTRYASFLDVSIKEFDNIHFNISAVEAKSLDPQYRLLMEVCWEALLDAGENPEELKNSNTGVFIGIDSFDYYSISEVKEGSFDKIGPYTAIGVSQHTAAGRISYYYDWKGPAIVCNTACSSSLSALNCAVSSLKNGQCDMAVVGGVNLLLSPVGFIGLSQFNAISPDGRCKTFDASADGFGRGEGCGVIILKRLDEAEKQGRNIRAIVKGIYAGQDGKSNGFYAPNGKAEQRVIENAIENAMISVDDVDYVETHGTGTVLGDLIESQALCGAFKKKKNKLKIGSVKSNMGHLEAASGMASIIKVLLSMKHHMLPPSINIKQLNPEINWNKLEVVCSLTEWKKEDGSPLIAGISSFGISGALVHTILESYNKNENENTEKLPQIPCSLLTVSAKNEKELRASVEVAKDFIEENPEKFSDIIYSMQKCRSTLPIKYAVCGKDSASLCAEIQSSLDSEEVYSSYSKEPAAKKHKIAFLFTGQGAIYKDIAIELYNCSPVYRKYFDFCCELFSKTLSVSIHDAVFGDNEDWVKRAIYSQAVTFSVEYSLYQYWKSLGIEPDIMLGHSIGEYAAACAFGVMTLEDAVQMISWRGQMMDSVEPTGKMMGILSDRSSVEAAIAESGTQNVGVAAYNADNNVTISGIADEVDDVVNCLQKKKRVFVNDLNIPYPFHTKLMSHYEADYVASMEKIKFSKPDKVIVSTVTADNGGTVFADSHYWAEHLSKTVRFAEAIRKVKELGADIYIEIGGAATLTGLSGQCLGVSDDMLFLPSLRKGKSAYAQISETIQQLYLNGIEISYDALYAGLKHSYTELYSYQFQKKEFWIDSKQDSDKVLSKTIDESEKVVVLKEQKKENKENRVKKKLLNDIKMITGNDLEDIRTDQDLFSLGLDSLMLLSLGKKIESSFEVEIPMDIFFTELNTIDALAEYLAENQADMPEEVPAETALVQPVAEVKTAAEAQVNPESIPAPVYNVLAVNVPVGNGNDISSLFNRQLSVMQEQLSVMKMFGGQMPVGQTVQAVPVAQKKEEAPKKEVKKMDTSYYKPYHKQDYKVLDASLTGNKEKYVKEVMSKYVAKMPSSKKYLAEYRFVNANARHNAGFKMEFKDMLFQVVGESGHGSHITDLDGNDIVDVTMGFGVNLFGYAPKFVIDALADEMKHGFPLGALGRKTGQVAELISELTGNERVFFCNSGTEADMFVVRIVRAATGKKKIVYFGGAYHGTSDGVLGLPFYEEDGSISAFPMVPGVTEGAVSDLVILNYNTPSALEYIKEHSDEIAGVLVEPVQSRRPDIQPREFLHELRKITQENNVALIFDEVITGFRICAGGAQEYFGVKADLTTYGKVLGGGMPIGVVAGSARFMNSVDGGVWNFGDDSVPEYENQRTLITGTFCHHPLTIAAAYATLSHIKAEKDTIYPEVNKKADYMVNTLNKFFEKEKVPFHMVNFGTLFRFMIGKEYEIFYYSLLEKGIFVWEGRNCFISTEHTYDDIERIISAVKETIREMKEAGFFPESSTLKTDVGVEDKNVSAERVITKPASLIQQRLYIETKLNELDPYDVVSAFSITKKIDEKKLEDVINEIIQRHEVLRTSFTEENDEIVMKIQPSCRIKIKHMESSEDHEKLIKNSLTKFDLSKAPLVEVIIVKHVYEDILIFHFHHIVADGMSMNNFNQEFISLYQNKKLPELKKQYSGYVDYENQMMTEEWINERREFWLNELQDCVTRITLPYDGDPKEATMAGSTYVDYIQKDITDKLKQSAKKQGVSLFMMLLSVMDVVLHKISVEKNFAISTPVTTRFAGGFEDNIGMFTNTMAFGCHIEPSESFAQLLKDVKKMSLASYSKSDYPYNMLVNDLDARDEKAINVSFVYENTDGRDPNHGSDLELKYIPFVKPVQEDEIVIEFLEGNGKIEVQIGYQTDLFKEDTISRIFDYVKNTINSIVEDQDVRIADIDILSYEEKQLILNDFNATETEYPRNKTVVELFEEQVKETPDNIALVFENQKLTYAELNARANSLAHKLRELGVKPDDFVAIIADRSIEMICGVYGIIKAGGAYVPIDPTYPEERIAFMLEDCSPKVVLKYTTESIALNTEIPVIDLADGKVWEGASDNLEIVNKPEDAIYCIYTSGTTGKSKGVILENTGLIGLIKSYEDVFEISSNDRMMQFASYCFDQSVGDVFGTMLNGAAIYIVSTDMRYNMSELEMYMKSEKITVASLTPKVIRELDISGMPELRLVDSGGEAAELDVLRAIAESGRKVINSYGPTEATVNTTYSEIKPDTEKVVIGIPSCHTKVYILKDKNLCGIGVPGELCIAGDGVARGYLNRPELTAEKFVKNPYGEGRMYRTGDLARWLPDGNIEYLGRIDEQVKIRGFRIELGEIESRIREIENIKDCAVIARVDSTGDKAIYAYYTSDIEVSVSEIRNRLSESLPEYMVPSYMMQIEKIPVNKNGKLDKKSLPEIEGKTTKEYVAPRNEIEEKICDIFSEILNVEQVSVKDGFFELGGHSLRATRLVNRIEAETGTRIALKEVFTHPAVEQLAVLVGAENEEYVPIPKAEEKEYYPMSSAQKRTYLIQQMEPEAVTYNMSGNLKLTGEVRPDDMRAALQAMTDRHEILRTIFLMIDGEPVQKILNHVEADFDYVTSSESDEELMKEFLRPFDLSSGKLVRIKLVDKGGYHLMMFDMHHIVGDGMSVNTFTKELMALYNGEKLEPLTHQFKDYSEWMGNRDLSGQAEYWKSQFDDEIPVLNMPTDYPRPQEQSYVGTMLNYQFGEELSGKIKELVKNTGATEYMVFLAATMVTLSKYSRQEDIVIGSPISGRTHRDTEGMLGMFVNTLAMRGKPEKNKTFSQFLHEIKETCLKAYENQEYPFEELVEAVDVQRDMSRNPIFDVMLVYQNNENVDIKFNNSEAEGTGVESTVAKFDMTFNISEYEGRFVIGFEYCTDLYKAETAERIVKHYEEVLKVVTENAEQNLGKIEMMTAEEKSLILNDFNATETEYPRDKTVVELFEEQVKRTPDNIALVFEDEKLTYAELNARANSLAHKLRELGVKPNDFVAIIADRSIEMICGVYGIIKAGGAYVPIDPTYPKDRIAFMLEDCKPKAALKYTTESIMISNEIPVIDLTNGNVWDEGAEDPEKVNKPNDHIYCIYTSGTTGQPKGAAIYHISFTNLVTWYQSEFKFNENDVNLFIASLCFDLGQKNLFTTLIVGGTLIVADVMKDGYDKLSDIIVKNKVTVINCAPSVFNYLINENADNGYKRIASVEKVFLGGEPINAVALRDAVESENTKFRIINTYGPTECTDVVSSYADVNERILDGRVIPIGKANSNNNIFIFNGENLCGVGVQGELCITGIGVSSAYINRPELTAEKFVKNPYGEGRMYRTGDLARWLPDGNIEYLGRIDEQVKIRGFRIELGEIESRIREIENIKDCAVIARVDSTGDKAIYAYYTSDIEVSVSEIRNRLSESLPEYMVPSYMMQIEKIPVNKNGKLDKKSLPEIEGKTTKEYVAPRNEIEEKICDIFSEILNVEQVSVKDGFFELGGHSLRATRLVNRIEAETGTRIALKEVFTHPAVEQLAVLVGAENEEYVPIPKAEEKEYYPMSSAQKRTYLIQQMEPEAVTYNMSGNLKLTGEVRPDDMRAALQAMTDRHEILRTIFLMIDGEPVQKILNHVEADFDYVTSSESDEELMKEFLRPFDLSSGKLVRIKLVDKGGYHLMMFDMHHIVGDGMSVNTFTKELMALYNGEKLEPLTHQFKDYSEWMGNRDLSGQAEYWKSQFDDEIPVLNMPTDYPRPQEKSYTGTMLEYQLNEDVSSKLKELVKNTGVTEYMVFLAVAMVTLSKYSRQEDIVIGSPISGRTHRDTEGMLGMLVNTLVMRGKPEKNKTFSQFLKEIKETCLKAYENQEYPFEELVEAVDVQRDMSRNPLFDVMLVLQNNDSTDIQLRDSEAEGIKELSTAAKFDMTFNIEEVGEKFYVVFEYCTDLFKEETAEQIVKHFEEILKAVTSNAEQKIGDIEMVTETEKQLILNDFNATETEYPRDKTVVELFEEQVKKTPDNIAVVFEDKKLTYAELNARANRLAHKLRDAGIKPDDFVAIIADRSVEMICGIYGIIKAGGAYVPIDPTYPVERIAFMLEDCSPKAVLKYTTESITITNEIPLIDLSESEVWEGAPENLEVVNKPGDAIYCIYTSGTTGEPKGVVIQERSLINHLYLMRKKFYICNEHYSTPLFTSFAFDFTVPAIFGTILFGDKLAVMKDVKDLVNYSKNNKFALLKITPSYFNGIYDEFKNHIGQIKTMVFGGESFTDQTLKNVYKVFGKSTKVFNEYGPTEATVFTTVTEIKEKVSVTIGTPVSNSQIYIMDDDTMCGIGVSGELCIAGDGLARGYLNRLKLTAEKFVKNPFGGGRMYRSGDFARWLPDGNIEYLGRIDEQVKIRGFRIELGEIESRIRTIENIKDCAVIARADSTGDKAIYAYYTSDIEESVSKIRDRLSESLPEYMIPAYMMQIEAIPVTRNGKIDKTALPEIEAVITKEYVAPRNETEEAVCSAFREILNVDQVGITDGFFELGGDSIKAIRIISKLRNDGYTATVKDVMTGKTAEKIAIYVKNNSGDRKYEQGEVIGKVESTPIIKSFAERKLEKPEHFNQSMMFPVDGIENSVIKQAIEELVKHHDVLRAVYRNSELEILPVLESKLCDFYEFDYSHEADKHKAVESKCTEIQGSINLKNGPFVKIAVFELGETKQMMFCIHHLAVDGVSWRILQEDFDTAVSQINAGKEIKLPYKTASFIEWSQKLKEYGEKLESREKEYWKKANANIAEGKIKGENLEEEICYEVIEFSKETTDKLLTKSSNAYGAKIDEVLLAGLARAVGRITGQKRVAVKLEGHGREDIHEPISIDRTVGWFTNIYTVLLECSEDNDEAIVNAKDTIRTVPNMGMGYGYVKHDGEPDICFNYLGDFSGSKTSFVSEYSAGDDMALNNKLRDNVVLNGQVSDGKLKFAIISQYGQKFVENLKNEFVKCIEEFAEYCSREEKDKKTISDMEFSNLDIEELSFINSLLG